MNMPMEANPTVGAERRRAPRSRCLRQARCVFNHGCSDLTTLVRNVSATGAKLVGDQLFSLPDEFELQISNGTGDVSARLVRRVWSLPDSIGVVFLEPERRIAAHSAGATPAMRSRS